MSSARVRPLCDACQPVVHEAPQHAVHAGLVSFPHRLEELDHIRIEPPRHTLFLPIAPILIFPDFIPRFRQATQFAGQLVQWPAIMRGVSMKC